MSGEKSWKILSTVIISPPLSSGSFLVGYFGGREILSLKCGFSLLTYGWGGGDLIIVNSKYGKWGKKKIPAIEVDNIAPLNFYVENNLLTLLLDIKLGFKVGFWENFF